MDETETQRLFLSGDQPAASKVVVVKTLGAFINHKNVHPIIHLSQKEMLKI